MGDSVHLKMIDGSLFLIDEDTAATVDRARQDRNELTIVIDATLGNAIHPQLYTITLANIAWTSLASL